MTPQAALGEIFDRIGAQQGAPVTLSSHELNDWCDEVIAAMKEHRVMTRASPATSAECPSRERGCVMPVHVLSNTVGTPEAFIVCEHRNNTHRVAVSIDRLEQWQASGESIADLLARLLELHRPDNSNTTRRWEIGMIKGARHTSHLVLVADNKLFLTLADHTLALAGVLALEGAVFKINKRALNRLVDHPIAGAGDTESAEQRRERLKKRKQVLKAEGNKAFLKVIADEEGVSVTRVKQLLNDKNKPPASTWDW